MFSQFTLLIDKAFVFIFFSTFVLICLLLAILCIRSGNLGPNGYYLKRKDSPIIFWLYVISYFIGAIFFSSLVILYFIFYGLH